MPKYPITHNTPAGTVVERGENQFFVRLYVGKSADGTRKYYSKTRRTPERAVQDLKYTALRLPTQVYCMISAACRGLI